MRHNGDGNAVVEWACQVKQAVSRSRGMLYPDHLDRGWLQSVAPRGGHSIAMASSLMGEVRVTTQKLHWVVTRLFLPSCILQFHPPLLQDDTSWPQLLTGGALAFKGNDGGDGIRFLLR